MYTARMSAVRLLFFAAAVARMAIAQDHVSFPTEDGGLIQADLYGTGDRGVVLAHGGQFTKESWEKQARILAANGFHVLAFDFRGFGHSHGPGEADMFTAPMYLDVLAAVRYLKKSGAKTVAVVGGSFGGGAAAYAAIHGHPGEIDRVVMLAGVPNASPENFNVPKLLIIARDDADADGPRLPGIRAVWEKIPEPKELIILEGSAHAQFLFQTDQGDRVMREILRFLSKP